jgi:hypothetical protein
MVGPEGSKGPDGRDSRQGLHGPNSPAGPEDGWRRDEDGTTMVSVNAGAWLIARGQVRARRGRRPIDGAAARPQRSVRHARSTSNAAPLQTGAALTAPWTADQTLGAAAGIEVSSTRLSSRAWRCSSAATSCRRFSSSREEMAATLIAAIGASVGIATPTAAVPG